MLDFRFPFSLFRYLSLLLHHLRGLNLAYFPYLVADGEKRDGYDDKDGEDEVEEEPGEVFAEAYVSIDYEYRCYDGTGNDNDNYGTDSEQAQVILAEEQDDIASVSAVNLSQGNLLLAAAALQRNGRIDTCYDAENTHDDENQA